MSITPTPGRIVWYRATPGEGIAFAADSPLPAVVCGVQSDTSVNLAVLGFNGSGPYPRTNVTLVQDEGQVVQPGECGWMPFQRGQAAATEKATGLLANAEALAEHVKNAIEAKLGEIAELVHGRMLANPQRDPAPPPNPPAPAPEQQGGEQQSAEPRQREPA